MARVTVEDCLENVDNRFELVLLATKRARQLAHGQESKVPWGKDKPTVVALREIALNLTNMGNVDAKPVVEEPEEEATIAEEQTQTPPANNP